MRVLFDQGTPIGIRASLKDHVVRTVREEGWSALSNGELFRAAEKTGFQALLTTDTNLPQQQDLKGRELAVVILSKNHWTLIKSKLADIAAAVDAAKAGTFSVVAIPNE